MTYTIFFALLVLLQFGAPVLAKKIQQRFLILGIKMKSNSNISFLNNSGFWTEAKMLNQQTKDPIIRKYLWLFNSWWILFGLGMVALYFGIGY